MKASRRQAIALLSIGLHAAARSATGGVDALARAALVSPRAVTAVLLGVAKAGDRVVAVGERGVVLWSDDHGTRWQQAAVPVSTTLTAVQFVSDKLGWAVGHAGVVLQTQDGGVSWVRQLDGLSAAALTLKGAQASGAAAVVIKNAERLVADGADKPLLNLDFADARRGVVVGAYGLVLGTDDGGARWTSWFERIDNPKGLHVNAVAARGALIVLVGEQGQLWRSTDGGQLFANITSPYQGSWFAACFLPSGRLVIAGLKGNAYFSDDDGATFSPSAIAVPITLSALVVLHDGSLLALNQAGQILLSGDQGQRFEPVATPPGAPMTGVAQLADSSLVGSSLRGPRVLPAPTPRR